jgi:hypothetical protein
MPSILNLIHSCTGFKPDQTFASKKLLRKATNLIELINKEYHRE